MLRSSIATGSYTLEKYSRSYPQYGSAQTQSQDLVAGQPEWQHFTNPVITLTLDVKKSMDNNFESVRLRIVWNIDVGHDGTQREITMEDLDLLSFSGLGSQVLSTQGPPLKAVYRGPVVGIRYQYPLVGPATSQTSYRRFQVNFTSASDAAQFIDAIRPVCPCKENAGPPPSLPPLPPPPSQTPTPRLPIPTSASMQGPSTRAPLVRHPTVSMAPQRPSMPPPSAGATTTTAIAMEHAHVHHYHNRSNASSQEEPSQRAQARFPRASSSDPSLALLSSSSLSSSNPAAPPPHPISGPDTSTSRPSSALLPEMMHPSPFAPAQSRDMSSSSLPSSSQPTSSAATLVAPQPSWPSSRGTEEEGGKTREAFLESLREAAPELYGLTRPELENLVSVVVREPGFPRLVEALDSMWVIRGFLGR